MAKHHRRVDPHSHRRVQKVEHVVRNVNLSDNIEFVMYAQYHVVSTSHLSRSRVWINVVFEHLAIGDGDGGDNGELANATLELDEAFALRMGFETDELASM